MNALTTNYSHCIIDIFCIAYTYTLDSFSFMKNIIEGRIKRIKGVKYTCNGGRLDFGL